MDALEKIVKARAGLILDQPFFGSLALRLTPKADAGAETLWTNGREIGFNADYIDSLSLEHVKAVLAHEVMHCACAHHARRAGRDPTQWNTAGDYAINPLLTEAGFSLPEGALIDPAFAGKSADEIYGQLGQAPKPQPGHDDGTDQTAGNGDGRPADGDGHPGDGQADPGQCGEVRDGHDGDMTPDQAENEWKVAVTQAAQQAHAMGTLPAGLDRMARAIVEPRVDWRAVLREFIERSARNDYNWCPPSRRYLAQGLYLPSLTSDELPEIVVAVDTSGSIDQPTVDRFASEISAILEAYDTTINVLYVDSTLQGAQTFGRYDLPLDLDAKGGGGTDFRRPFDWIETEGKTPACLVYLTDLCGRFPDAEPDYPVLWVATENHGEAPFGETVRM